jgi:hypothetical protein
MTAFDRGKRQAFSMAFGGYRLHDYATDWLQTSRSGCRVSFTLYMIGMEIRVNRMRTMTGKVARHSAHWLHARDRIERSGNGGLDMHS